MTLLPGVRVDEAVSDLTEQVNRLNTLGSGSKFEVFDSYLRWAADAADVLASRVSPEDVEKLVLTRRHWALCGIDPAANGAITRLVNAEVSDRRRNLFRAIESLVQAQERWSALGGKILVADTNVYLHHQQPFDEVDWGVLVNAAEHEPIHLIIPILVVDELDRAKRGRNETRARARASLRKLAMTFEDPDVSAQFAAGTSLTTAHLLLDSAGHKRLADADSELIDRTFALTAFTGSPATVVTFDTGMALRARAAGLRVRHLMDE